MRGPGKFSSHILKDVHSGQRESPFTHHAIHHEIWLRRFHHLHKVLAAAKVLTCEPSISNVDFARIPSRIFVL